MLDELFSPAMAEQLRERGHDVIAVAGNPATAGLPDEQVLMLATDAGRAVVTANIKDFQPIDANFQAAGHSHAGLIFVSTKTFPQGRGTVWTVMEAVAALLDKDDSLGPDKVVFLPR